MALEIEMETYKENLPNLLENEGKFVIIKGTQVVDIMQTYEDALKTAYEKYGLNDHFLIKRIQAVETAMFLTRRIIPACL